MARAISDFNGTVIPAGGANPYGYTIDAPNGTVVDNAMMADMIVFFQRMMSLAGITPNGNPDNSTNTFQLWLAFLVHINPNWSGAGFTFTNSGNNVWANKGAGYGKFHYLKFGNWAALAGVIKNTSGSTPVSSDMLTLPTSVRPIIDRYVRVWSSSPTPELIELKISTTGVITSTTGCDGDVFLDGVMYNLSDDAY